MQTSAKTVIWIIKKLSRGPAEFEVVENIFGTALGKEQIWGRVKVKQFGDKVKGAKLRFLNVGCCVASV